MEYDYIITKPPLDEDTLAHYGVKGMKWRHRKGKKKSSRSRSKIHQFNGQNSTEAFDKWDEWFQNNIGQPVRDKIYDTIHGNNHHSSTIQAHAQTSSNNESTGNFEVGQISWHSGKKYKWDGKKWVKVK